MIDDIQTLLSFSRSSQNVCFACGPGNPCGLHLTFEADGTGVRATFVARSDQGGWAGVIHGGILATVLDEAMAYVLYFQGHRAVTARLEVRYREPVADGDVITVVAEPVKEVRNITDVRARLLRGDDIVAEGASRMMKLGPLTMEALKGAPQPGRPVALQARTFKP